MLSEDEIKFYSRQLLVDEIGWIGQMKLKKSKVLVIGAGGLGCPVLQYLSAAGVGTIGIIDGDIVEISNLHRQILFTTDSIGKNKAFEAKEKLRALNPHVTFKTYSYQIKFENVLNIIEEYECIVDCTDNYETRFLVNDACVLLKKPLIYGSIYRFEGQVSVFNYDNGPTYRCVFPEIPSEESTTNCSLSGVIGVLPGIIGVMQANEVIKFITGIGELLSGKLLVFDARNNSIEQFVICRDPSVNYLKLLDQDSLHEENYSKSCCDESLSSISEVETSSLLALDKKAVLFLDVREPNELPAFVSEYVLQIPLKDIRIEQHKIPVERQIIVFCKSGIRSKKAIVILKEEFGFQNLINLKDGISNQLIEQWQKK